MSDDKLIYLRCGQVFLDTIVPLTGETTKMAEWKAFRLVAPALCQHCGQQMPPHMGTAWHPEHGHHHLNCWLARPPVLHYGLNTKTLKRLLLLTTMHTLHHYAWSYHYPGPSLVCEEGTHTYGCGCAGVPWNLALRHHPLESLNILTESTLEPYPLKLELN